MRVRVAMNTLLLVGAAGTACGEAEPGMDGSPVGPRLEAVGPEVRIGAVDDPVYAFGAVRTLAVSPDGARVYSLHRNDAYVRIWTSDGLPAGTLGGPGEGPGEFTRPGLVGFFGDSLWVMDTYAYRVSFFDSDGDFLGSIIPRVDIAGSADQEWSPPRPERPLRDGSFIARSPAWSDGIARGTLTRTPFVRMTGNGEPGQLLWMQPFLPRDILALLDEDGVGGTYFMQPFADDPLVQSGQHGLTVVQRRAWEGEGEAAIEVLRIGLDGDTVWSTPIPYEPLRLPGERVDAAIRELADNSFDFFSGARPGIARGAYEADLKEQTYAPDWAPAVRSMVLADDGSVWLERFQAVQADDGSPRVEWWVVDEGGRLAGSVRTPEGLRILAVTDDAVWGVELDELEVSYIVRYALRPA